jgi:hypothetical protein
MTLTSNDEAFWLGHDKNSGSEVDCRLLHDQEPDPVASFLFISDGCKTYNLFSP